MRNEAKLLNVNRESVRRVVRDNLGLHPYKLRKSGKLSDLQKSKRLERCRLLRRRSSEKSVKKIVISDEKIFRIEQKLNAQNDRVYATSIEDLPESFRAVRH
jgi:inhibitor of nuclear factor kappa-B kinase subunit alpha